MSKSTGPKPTLRGHSHQAAFFVALGACLVLLAKTPDRRSFFAILIYTIGLTGLFGVSAIYHRPHWGPVPRARLRRLDHAAIYLLIAGTFTPVGVLGVPGDRGIFGLKAMWILACCGIFQSLFWVTCPKWLNALLYVGVSWIALSFFSGLEVVVGDSGVTLIFVGGICYTVGALIYALRRPNPWPRTFGYHEIFHAFVVLGAFFHFIVVYRLVR
ncbi:MAG: hemolysin III family protein [Bdellovibrionota bacterium]